VLASTVHRAQGSERNTVIFDPVHASTSFLNNRDLGPRLMNVALSRAKARLFVIASRENLLNPVIRQIANIIEGDGGEVPDHSSHSRLLNWTLGGTIL
jgi:superfamily I DNA/RNA helicase